MHYNPESIIVNKFEEFYVDPIQEEEVVDVLMKPRVFRNLFEDLEFGEQAQGKVIKAILEVFRKFGEQRCVISKDV